MPSHHRRRHHHHHNNHHHHAEPDNEPIPSREDDEQYPREYRHSSSNYRRHDSSLQTEKGSYPGPSSSSSRGHRDSNWRPKDYDDEYYRERREGYELAGTREPASWPAPTSEREWGRYESDYPPHYGEQASWPAHDHRNGHQERWDNRGGYYKRQSDRPPVVDERRDWSNRSSRGSGNYDPWSPPQKSISDERAWEPAPGWQPSTSSDHQQNHRGQNQSFHREDTTNHNHYKQSPTSRRGGNTHNNRYTNNKPQREWQEESSPNNWSRRGYQESERAPLPSRKHNRSMSPVRSPSRSPAESYYSRRSSRGRTRSPSPALKKQKREPVPSSYDHENMGWVPNQRKAALARESYQRQNEFAPPPRIPSPTSSLGTRRSRSRSPRSDAKRSYRLPSKSATPSNAPSYDDSAERRVDEHLEDRNGAEPVNDTIYPSEPPPGYDNDAQSMPPPSIIPNAINPLQYLPEFSRTSFSQPISSNRKGGFKPIGQNSSSLRKFFPGDDDDLDLSAQPTVTEQTEVIPSAGPRSPNMSHSRASSIVMDEEENPDAPVPPSQQAVADTNETRTSTPSTRPRAELYAIMNHVGEGTFGKVYKAQNTITRLFVALKRIRMESEKEGFPVTAMREIKLLQSLRHENVVRLFEMMVSNGSVYMVFEYMEHDLTGVLSQTQFSFTDAHLKSLCRQMLAGLAYLHHKGVIHRDIKGSNILLNNRGELKLADFGLARFYQKRRRSDYTNRVITLWYRPPELLLGATVYGPEVDMWSAGCIMLELFTKKPVFQGNDEIHQLDTIYRVFGTPTVERWPDIVNLPWYELVKPREEIPNHFREMFRKWMSPAALDLAERLLFYDPATRATAVQALDAPYFTQEEPPAMAPTGLATLLHGEWHELETKKAKKKKKE
ncbi:Pkinase-domain-containing protein [Mycena indigotica]|uniref:Pkinase-domain-containing protein n=1 Tax=Mycena indigotica TaxID=2126181 RepID=A0A8H6W147_9AGAR|nr:Pkinase-domain-containing protein [Mycena indigotica]KAF7301679.1 Pkinase-domain-containing protein [Mycena indigotica]